jgi:RNA polymerase sigma-70 factor (ECF subfamily)
MELQCAKPLGQRTVRERVTPFMTAFVTLAGVYSTPENTSRLGGERSRDQELMTTSRALDQFLSSVEKRAFKIAQLGLRNDDDALDAVQDSMMKLVQSYASRPVDEWRPLFYRILANRIRDMQRRRTVRGRIMAWLPMRDSDDDEEADPVAHAASHDPGPAKRLELDEAIGVLETAVAELPPRQQEAFLLRNLEGLDVGETASAMGCSEGSVKTHYFRALSNLRAKLGEVF